MSTSIIEIERKALKNNISFLKEFYGENVKISTVVKGNAYGHGLEQVIPVFEEAGIDHFSVFSSEEAHRVVKVKSKESTLMIMGFIDRGDIEWILQNGLELYIFEPSFLERVVNVARCINKKAVIHLELETGMHRTGLTKAELEKTIKIINENLEYIHIKGFATHLAGAESIANYHRIMYQLRLFHKRIAYINRNNLSSDIIHSASSAASISYPKSRMDLVRAGIISYGFWPTRETFMQFLQGNREKGDPLKRALRWKSKIMSVKAVKEGKFIGYGYNFQATHDMKVGVIPVGYANGYSRLLSNNGHVLVNGMRADVIGSVNMNMILVNVTEIPNIKIGDEAVLLGQQGDHEISVASFSEMNNSMNYELLSRLPGNIKRILV